MSGSRRGCRSSRRLVAAVVSDEDEPELPPDFDPEAFKRALAMGYDPWAAVICAMPPRRTEKGSVVYRRTDDG